MRTDYTFVTQNAVVAGVPIDDRREMWELDHLQGRPISITVHCTFNDLFGYTPEIMAAWMKRARLLTPTPSIRLFVL